MVCWELWRWRKSWAPGRGNSVDPAVRSCFYLMCLLSHIVGKFGLLLQIKLQQLPWMRMPCSGSGSQAHHVLGKTKIDSYPVRDIGSRKWIGMSISGKVESLHTHMLGVLPSPYWKHRCAAVQMVSKPLINKQRFFMRDGVRRSAIWLRDRSHSNGRTGGITRVHPWIRFSISFMSSNMELVSEWYHRVISPASLRIRRSCEAQIQKEWRGTILGRWIAYRSALMTRARGNCQFGFGLTSWCGIVNDGRCCFLMDHGAFLPTGFGLVFVNSSTLHLP